MAVADVALAENIGPPLAAYQHVRHCYRSRSFQHGDFACQGSENAT